MTTRTAGRRLQLEDCALSNASESFRRAVDKVFCRRRFITSHRYRYSYRCWDTQAASFVILISRHCHIKWHASEAKLCEGYGRCINIPQPISTRYSTYFCLCIFHTWVPGRSQK